MLADTANLYQEYGDKLDTLTWLATVVNNSTSDESTLINVMLYPVIIPLRSLKEGRSQESIADVDVKKLPYKLRGEPEGTKVNIIIISLLY